MEVKKWRVMAWLGLVVVVAVAFSGCAVHEYLKYKSDPDFPQVRSEALSIPGLSQPVTVYLDKAGISHISAQNELDLARATGFMQGRSRFFEMDMMRRIARGRVSALVGNQKLMESTTSAFDRSMRGWGFDRAVVEDEANLDPEMHAILNAFVDGVNHALSVYKPLEYRLLQVEPEPWRIGDTFALGRLNAWGVSHNWHQELSRFVLALHAGLERGEAIYPNEPWDGGTSIAPAGEPMELPPAVVPEMVAFFEDIMKQKQALEADGVQHAAADGAAHDSVWMTAASNSWVVAGDHSRSGKPIIANDPHMAHFLPSLAFQMHLSAPGVDVIGATIAGLPYVLMGHNEHVAWGMTSSVGDAIDLVVEKVNPDNPNQYLTPDGWADFEITEETIQIRKGKKLTDTVVTIRRTRNGAVINDMYPDILPPWAPPLAIRWDLNGVYKSFGSLREAASVATVDQLRLALYDMASPSTTWMTADDSGTIGVFASGTIPVRKLFRGTFPVPGWLQQYEWGTERIAPEDLPQAVKTEGMFAHANNLMINSHYQRVLFNVDSAPSYRFDRIMELLQAESRHTKESIGAIQTDQKLNRGKRLTPYMIADLKAASASFGGAELKSLELLETWNYVANAESPQGAIFFATYREAIISALQDEVDAHAFEFILSQRYSTNVADQWFDRVDHPIWDDLSTAAVEVRSDILVPAFKRAVAYLISQQGNDPTAWRWGKLHSLHLSHFFGAKKAIGSFVNLEADMVGGGLDSVWKSHFDLGNPEKPFAAMAGPVYRMVVDLGDIKNGLWVIETGVSGWPGSPHYGDQHELWLRGEYLQMTQDWTAIKESAKAVLQLSPAEPIQVESVTADAK
jgi:penicillin amidase